MVLGQASRSVFFSCSDYRVSGIHSVVLAELLCTSTI